MTNDLNLKIGAYRFVPAKSSVRITARAPAHTFQAEGTGLSGIVRVEQDGLTELEVEFPLARLDAKDALKNHELSRFLTFKTAPIARAVASARGTPGTPGTPGERLIFSRALPSSNVSGAGSDSHDRAHASLTTVSSATSAWIDGSGEVLITSPTGSTALTKVRFSGEYPTFHASFETSFSALGYSPPRLLFLKVQDRLSVEVKLTVSEDDTRARES
ncbi:MAG: hypothetical protein H6729_01110 [Deltaproteobacteria bacterium]|nr:hypothetical protein [Deltaproteobacteria bacterium]